MNGYLYIFSTIVFTVFGQLVLKWRISKYGEFPLQMNEKLIYLAKLFLDPFLVSGLASAFIASIFWLAVLTKFEISYAYPFISIAFVLVLLFSVFMFKETLTIQKVVGMMFIVLGIVITSRS
jgi:multidrug transporter EmrE-like cation transporter